MQRALYDFNSTYLSGDETEIIDLGETYRQNCTDESISTSEEDTGSSKLSQDLTEVETEFVFRGPLDAEVSFNIPTQDKRNCFSDDEKFDEGCLSELTSASIYFTRSESSGTLENNHTMSKTIETNGSTSSRSITSVGSSLLLSNYSSLSLPPLVRHKKTDKEGAAFGALEDKYSGYNLFLSYKFSKNTKKNSGDAGKREEVSTRVLRLFRQFRESLSEKSILQKSGKRKGHEVLSSSLNSSSFTGTIVSHSSAVGSVIQSFSLQDTVNSKLALKKELSSAQISMPDLEENYSSGVSQQKACAEQALRNVDSVTFEAVSSNATTDGEFGFEVNLNKCA